MNITSMGPSLDPYQEKLDDLHLPLAKRLEILRQLDQANRQFKIYKKFVRLFDDFYRQNFSDLKKISIVEVGASIGGLMIEILGWAKQHQIEVEVHLFDIDLEVLKVAETEIRQKGFENIQIYLHPATEQHLKVFPEGHFDFLISLHVIHHIQPFSVAVDAIHDMAKVVRKGCLIVDFDRFWGSILFAQIWNFLFSVPRDLSEDGKKSMQRAFSISRMRESLSASKDALQGQFKISKALFFPYWILEITKK